MGTKTIIMAVPWTPDRVKHVALVKRSEPDAEVVWADKSPDQGMHGLEEWQAGTATHTWLRAIHAAGNDAAIFLEDDVTLCEGWRDKIEKAISERPDEVIQFFSMRKADLTVGSRYEPGRLFLMNQCFYLPAGAAARLYAYAREITLRQEPGKTSGNDLTTAAWLKSEGLRYWVHVPSLVQHDVMVSEIDRRRSSKRQSFTFEK